MTMRHPVVSVVFLALLAIPVVSARAGEELRVAMQQVDLYATRDRLEWTPRADQWLLFHEAVLK